MFHLFSLFCRHDDWKIVVEEKTKSQIEILVSNGCHVPSPTPTRQNDKL